MKIHHMEVYIVRIVSSRLPQGAIQYATHNINLNQEKD